MSGRCSLCPGIHKCLPPDGTHGDVLFIGEAPGYQEEQRGRVFCLEENTRVLMLDLTWKPIGQISVGDQLLAFDEESDRSRPRRWRPSTVTGTHASIREAIILLTEKSSLVGTGDHRVLVDFESSAKKKHWLPIDRLMVGEKRQSCISYIGSPWGMPNTYDAGWLSGFFNGEGHLMGKKSSRGSAYAGFAQNSGPLCSEALLKLQTFGFQTFRHGTKSKKCEHHYVAGGFKETLRFLGSIRPSRLLNNLQVHLAKRGPEFRTDKARVLGRYPVGLKSVVDITTTSGTFIAEGFAVHNCGKTGQEVDVQYLPLAGLSRGTVVMANAISCYPITNGGKLDPNRVKDQELLESCSQHHLIPLIERIRPKMLVPMGAFACRVVCPDVNLEVEHGFPVSTAFGIPAFPMYHPALGIHEPKRMLHLRNDWQRLRHLLRNALITPSDDYAGMEDYAEITSVSEFSCLDPTLPLAGDTETVRGGDAYCLTFTQLPGYGRLIRAERHDLLSAFNRHLQKWESDILFHNWLFDAAVVEKMGLSIPHRRIVDTMVRVFHLGNLPQGLKALAWRELGMVMQDFDDLVTPHSTLKVLEYYRNAHLEAWPKPEPELVRDPAGKWKMYKAQGLNTKLKRFFTDLANNPAKDVFKTWDNWEPSQPMIEERLGPWPGKDIRHVPFAQVLHYACRDVDALIRLWPILKGMGHRVRKFSQENWRAA